MFINSVLDLLYFYCRNSQKRQKLEAGGKSRDWSSMSAPLPIPTIHNKQGKLQPIVFVPSAEPSVIG